MRDVIVLAGGYSVASYNLRDLERRGLLIAINEAAVYTKPDVAVSMDRKWSEWRYPLLRTLGIPKIVLREGCNRNFKIDPGTTEIFTHLDTTGMTTAQGRLNGSNSGTCGLNYALQLMPYRIFMLGFDMKRTEDHAYWYPSYGFEGAKIQGNTGNRTYFSWALEFEQIAIHFQQQNILVYNVTHDSAIKVFPTISFDTFTQLCPKSP